MTTNKNMYAIVNGTVIFFQVQDGVQRRLVRIAKRVAYDKPK